MRQITALGLRHLADLVVERHARHQVGNSLSHGQVRVQVRQPLGVDDDDRLVERDVGSGDRQLDRDRLRLGRHRARQRLDGERLHASRCSAGREGHGAARVGVVGARDGCPAAERVVHRDVVVERLVAVGRQLDADGRGVTGVDRIHTGRRGDVGGDCAGVDAVECELVDVELTVARPCRLGQREAAHRVQVERTVDRSAGRLVVGAQLQRAERDLDQVPALPVVGEERLPELGVLSVSPAVLDLELVLRP